MQTLEFVHLRQRMHPSAIKCMWKRLHMSSGTALNCLNSYSPFFNSFKNVFEKFSKKWRDNSSRSFTKERLC